MTPRERTLIWQQWLWKLQRKYERKLLTKTANVQKVTLDVMKRRRMPIKTEGLNSRQNKINLSTKLGKKSVRHKSALEENIRKIKHL